MAVTEQLRNLVDQMPDPDGRGMLTEGIDKAKIDRAVAALAAGGKESLLGIIEILGEPGSPENAKPHYALHCVVNHSLVVRDERLRKELCEAMASQLQNQQLLPYNRAYLCQELQWAGRDEACEALGNALLDEDLSDAAAMALTAIGGERAAAELRRAVSEAEGKARLNIIDALAALADGRSTEIFRQALADKDQNVRIAASAGLANVGHAAAEDLLRAADSAKGWERTQATKACLVLAEKLMAAGKCAEAETIYERLLTTRTGDSQQHIRQAAQRGLDAMP